ncbi:hypothetical protein RIF29_14022 [Crotalaria pallida]|uniref:Tudor domain-containing protein n=1 Tax=Crotalaria pallida TaxID=3830 RepID=A0AAN9IB77_CROPI
MTSSNGTEMDSIKRLQHLGRKLLNSHSLQLDELLILLHKLALVLSKVDQSPSEAIKKSLEPSIQALISDELLRHADEAVKISVTCCFTEITRITAPEAPYDDEQMKEIFKLIVAAFEKLSHVSGYCYDKALTIIYNVEKVRLCLVMLDLELDDLVIEMFQQFLRNIRSYLPRQVIGYMETVMTQVLNESEEISSDLLRPLLNSARKENQVISPISWALAEKVFTNCALNLKPYLMNAVESSGRALDEYAQIVATICQNGSEFPQHAHSNGSKKTEVQEPENELNIPKDADKKPSDVTKITCVRSTMNDENFKKSHLKGKKHSDPTKSSNSRNTKANAETAQEPKSETQLNTVVPMKRVRKPNSLMNEEEGYGISRISKRTKAAKPALSKKARDSSSAFPPSEIHASRKDKLQSKPKTASEILVSESRNENNEKDSQSRKIHDIGSADENPVHQKNNELSKPEEMSEGHEALVSKPKTDENNHVAYPSTSGNIPRPNGGCTKRGRRPRKRSSTWNDSKFVSKLDEGKLNPLLEDTSLESRGVRFGEEPGARKDSEVKPQIPPIRRIKFTFKNAEKTAMAPEMVGAEMEPKASCDDVGKNKSVIITDVENGEESKSSFRTGAKKKRMLNATPKRDLNELSAIKSSETCDIGDSLVHSRIKVWWPMDKMYYEGVVESYDPVKQKHKIVYDDDEVEVLNLNRQRWEKIVVDTSPDEEQGLALHKLAEASHMDRTSTSISICESAKSKRMKTSSCIKNNKTNDLAKEKAVVA